MKSLHRLGRATLLAIGSLAAACGGGDPQVHAPRSRTDLAPALAVAFKEEAIGDPVKSVDLYVRALDGAAKSPDSADSVPIAMAALDALVHRTVNAFRDSGSTSALADRVDPALLKKNGGTVDERLARVQESAEGPFVRSLVANARLALAERSGDAKRAAEMRARTGCVREAALIGPVGFTPVSGVRLASALDRADASFPGEVTGPGPFAPKSRPLTVRALGCFLPLWAETSMAGVREVVVDVEVPQAGIVGVGLKSPATATLRAGGKIALERSHALGEGQVARFARVEAAGAGVMRIVVRAGVDSDYESIELGVWDDSGRPLRTRTPTAGSTANLAAKRAEPVLYPKVRTDEERLALALGAMAARESRTAENFLSVDARRADAPPELLLAYARAVRNVRDLPAVKINERARAAVERLVEVWPIAWEAALEHATLAGARRGHSEVHLETLSDLDATRAKAKHPEPALLDAFEAQVAGRERLYDRASQAFGRARTSLPNTALLRNVERLAFERTGKEAATFECAADANNDRSSLLCRHALHASGDRDGAERELERLRGLAGSPQLYLSLSTRNAVESGDLGRAGKLLDAMNPGDRPLSTLYSVKGKSGVSELFKLAVTARDAPTALPALLRASGDDPLLAFEGVAEKVTSDPALGPAVANAATAVLAHDERYSIEPNGLVHYVMLDVRRVMGTTDVEANAQAGAPQLLGRDTGRVLRRRIFKSDGRILLPDRTPHAAQSHADLSQLEAGDTVEAIYEGWALPGELGNVGIDTPDLLPERTAIRDARIELRVPQGLRGALWSHPMLGKAEEKVDQGKRVLVWRMKDRPIRRLEAGVPKMDRSVGVSFSTATWDDVAQNLRESIAALDADDPEIAAWAAEIGSRLQVKEGPKTAPSAALVDAVVSASGQAIKEASGIILADVDLGRSGGMTARTFLATHEGSRSWLVVKALRELGVGADVVVAENEPFSDSATFPPHFGRFMHPLVVAHVPDPDKAGATRDVWVDADVPGPPLPAGRISPELRGRMALWPDGRIAALPAVGSGSERDEIDIRLTVDEAGNAKGSLTALLRGRAAQDLAEALVRLVGLERQRALRGIALAWVPFATVEKVELSSSEGSWQIAIRAELSAPAYAQMEGGKGQRTWVLPGIDPIHYVFPRPYVTTLGSTYASHGARENALAINHAAQYHVRRRVDLPAKSQIVRVPGPFEGKGPLLSAERKISVQGTSIEEDFTLDVTTGTIPKDRYEAFVTEVHRTDDAFRASTKVKAP